MDIITYFVEGEALFLVVTLVVMANLEIIRHIVEWLRR
jgi:hypothetical protein